MASWSRDQVSVGGVCRWGQWRRDRAIGWFWWGFGIRVASLRWAVTANRPRPSWCGIFRFDIVNLICGKKTNEKISLFEASSQSKSCLFSDRSSWNHTLFPTLTSLVCPSHGHLKSYYRKKKKKFFGTLGQRLTFFSKFLDSLEAPRSKKRI